ncbi:hypothetical protein BJX70DRAFT_356467 [Aspergillus crustosus]
MATCTAPACSNPGTHQCSGCKPSPVRYCSADCQKKDWKSSTQKDLLGRAKGELLGHPCLTDQRKC